MNQPTLPGVVGVVGGGRMGAGIAHVLSAAGVDVVIIEGDAAAVEAASGRVDENRAKAAAHGEAASGKVTVGTDIDALAEASLVIEAVPERVEIKSEVLARTAEAAPQAVLATNTSAIPIDVLAQALKDPGRLIGLHFFNPVPVSKLIEIVVGTRTDPALVPLAQGWVEALGKTAVTVRDSPGFASSRLGLVLGLEAIRMLEDGVASADDIDAAMVLGYGHAAGPLRTADIVGLDVRLAIAEHLAAELGPRFAVPELLRRKVARGELGRKTGRGFFDW
jgi:3-hydroxybutyryl-CoA dehydrogenase